jgi:glycosyltransferase involved in cell wall biosynthesis
MNQKISSSLPKVSVCVITYNHEKFIAHTLDSILMQKTKFPMEIVIGEDCSTDGTRRICEEYAARFSNIVLLPSEKNRGISENFARTLNACSGDYIAICEGDDYWTDPQKIEIQTDFLLQHPAFSLCFHPIGVDRMGKIKRNSFVGVPQSETDASHLARSNYIFTPSVVYRSACISIDQIRNDYSTIYDYVIWMECASKGKLKYIDRRMANYRIHEDNKWATFNRVARLFTWLEIMYSLDKRFPGLKADLRINKQSTISVFLDDFYQNDDLLRLNTFLTGHHDEQLLLNCMKDRIVQLKSSTSYRLGRTIVRFFDLLLIWRRKKLQ